ncbi:hypothetical protein H489_0106855 [Curtobacterium flaccumfaciens UCD-AKU]|nr:hypothetical protein H489_0106855 [Curtobacterium flaccumfaciens UCD-AKU]
MMIRSRSAAEMLESGNVFQVDVLPKRRSHIVRPPTRRCHAGNIFDEMTANRAAREGRVNTSRSAHRCFMGQDNVGAAVEDACR